MLYTNEQSLAISFHFVEKAQTEFATVDKLL